MFYVECYADETLIRFILRKLNIKTIIIHAANKSRILQILSKNRGIGLVDEDPTAPQGIVTRDFLEKTSDENLQVKIYVNSLGSHLVVLRPRLEDWLIRICELTKININKYGLPKNSEELHKTINQKRRNLETLLEVLYRKSKIFRNFATLLRGIILASQR